jgi:hypothetical protein
MFVRTSKWLVVAMLALTLGVQWTVLQSVAWVGMIVHYSCDGSLQQAMVKTFDGQHPCPLCKLVRAGSHSDNKPATQPTTTRFDLFAGQSFEFYFLPTPAARFSCLLALTPRFETPPVPPPRALSC